RGTTLMEGSGNSKSFICPYHHWTYDNTGDLIAAPSIKASDVFDPASCRLPEFRCTQWRGFLFVTLSELTPDLHTGLQALDAEIGNYHLEEMQLKYVAQDLWSVNWKSLMENYMEGYHLTPLHRETLHKVNPTRLCQHMAPGESHFGYRVGFTTRVPQDTIGHPDLSADERNSCVMAAIPPGLGIGIGSDYSSFICLTPESPESVNVKTGLLFFGDNWPDQDVEQAVALFQHTMKEDEDVLVRVRDGLRSNAYQPGPLAPQDLEGTVWDFYQYLSRHLATLPN
ncbi:MAG: SRPBCC family protein, partial [Pseudomonadota bacterium]